MPRSLAKGFTLLEMVMVIVILSIIAITGSVLLQQEIQLYFTTQAVRNVSSQGRYALENMVRHIRQVRSTGSISTYSTTQFTFVDNNGHTISYQQSGTQLLYSDNGSSSNLLSGLAATGGLTFSYLDQNGFSTTNVNNINYISININLIKNNVNYALRTTVFLRSLV